MVSLTRSETLCHSLKTILVLLQSQRLCKGVLSVNLGPTELRDKRFKVTTIEAGGAPAGGAGGAAGGAGTSGAAGGGKGGSAAGQGQPKK